MAPMRALATLVAHATAIPAVDDFLPNWMGRVGSVIADQTILDLTFPGTHDTMTYDLSTTVSAGGIDNQDALALILSNYGDLKGIGEFMRGQAHTQALSITEQLDAGIRFLDFRIMFTDSDWYNLHFMRSNQKAITYLQQVRAWMDNHPTEILVMWLSKHGTPCSVGNDQYPNVTLANKQSMWEDIQETFQGLLLDTSQSSLNGTSVTNLLARSHRLAIFASDFVEFTGSASTTLATDGCSVDNHLALSSVTGEDLQHDLNYFSGIKDIRAADKENGQFFLLSMANSQPDDMIEDNALMTFVPGGIDEIQACASAFNIPNMTHWCPPTLLNVGQLHNYYKQQTLEVAYNAGYSFPNAIYIDAVGPGGTIRTGTKLLSEGENDTVCDIYSWSPCQRGRPTCDVGWTANGESTHLSVYDGFGNKQSLCVNPFQKHWKCCRNTEHTTDGYAYADTLIAYNVRKACQSTAANSQVCESVMSMMEERRSRHPLVMWSDQLIGRSSGWDANATTVVV